MAEAHARHTDPDTSHAAAATVGDLPASQRAVLAVLRYRHPMTFDQLLTAYSDQVDQVGILRQSESGIRTRVSELVKAGLVRDSGLRGTTRSGRSAIRWEAV